MGTMIELTASDGFTFDAYHVAPAGPRKGGLVGHPVYAKGHARNNGYAAGRKAAGHVLGHRSAVPGGLA